MTRFVLAIVLLFFALPALAQDAGDAEAERSYFVSYVEGQLSTPNRQIRINGIQGVLSSNASIAEITIADRQGVWLRITNARIVWTRRALFLGRLDIETLAADRIDVLRKPLPAEGLPPPEAGSLQIPELPLAVNIGALNVPLVTFGDGVFGLASQISVGGHLHLVDGSLDTALDVTRLDGPGGQLALNATYARETQVFGLDFSLSEPADGIVANLLNIEGRPPVVLALQGEGPLAQLDLALALDAGAQRVLTGTTRIRQQPEGLGFAADVHGPIAILVPPRFRDFFGSETKLLANGLFKEAGGLLLERLDLDSGALHVASSAETSTDGFLEKLKLAANIAGAAGAKVVLPVSGGTTMVEQAGLTVSFGQESDEKWSGSVTLDQLSTDTFASQRVALTMGGLAQNLALPAQRHITFALMGAATGITAVRADVAKALGEQINLDIAGDWTAGNPLRLAKALLSGNGLSVSLAGDIAGATFNGDIKVKAASIAPFSELAGRELSGALDLDAAGSIEPINGGFDLSIDSLAWGLAIGSEAVDNLLRGDTRITGGLARGKTGIVARQLRIFNDQTSATANGTFATGTADFDFDLALSDLALVSERASGKLTANGHAKGSDGLIGITFNAGVPSGSLVDKTLRDAVLGFEGTLQNGEINGQINGQALLDSVAIKLSSAVALLEKERSFSAIDFSAGATRITGDLTQILPAGLYQGQLKLASTDISTAAALLLTEASGSVNADVVLKPDGARQNATMSAQLKDLVVDTTRIGQADLQASVADLLTVPMIDGTARASDVAVAGIEIAQLNATATQKEGTTNFSADAQLRNGASAAVGGALSQLDGGYRVRLDAVDLKQGALAARLTAPSTIQVQGQNLAIDNLLLDVGGGQVGVRGTIAEKLNLAVSIKALPLAIANAVRPDLALSGTIDGSGTVTGTRVAPDVAFDLKGRTIVAAALRQAGLRSINVDAKGTSSAQKLSINASVTSPEGLQATAAGAVPLDGGALALDVNLKAFPLAVLNTVVPGQQLGGTISGAAKIAGSLAQPKASFTVSGDRLSATALDDLGLSPLKAAAAGSFADQVITLSTASASSPAGLSLAASGRVDLAGSGTNIAVKGQAPLSLANRFLADRGTQLSGTVVIAASLSGSLKKPSINGTISTSGAQVVDPEANLRLSNVALDAAIDGNTVTIRRASAAIGGGGSIAASGTISMSGNLPADIRITLDNARYADGNMVVATLDGRLAVTGPLLRDPLLSGEINVIRAEITVPETLGGGAAALDVKHIDASKAVRETLRRAKANDGTPMPTSRPSVIRLDVNVSAPNQIFLRGRGLDAELGGSVRLTGPVTNIQPVGGFRLIRGRLSILGQRITFDEGTVSLVGDLDPFVDFVARSSGSDITVFITVRGRVSDLNITFSSQPELPQDEVLARLIFNRGINELSAFQIAQLAAAAAELAGGGNTSLLGSLRAATGLDDLDVVTDSQGNAAVRAGRYIQENVYLGVEAGERGSTKGTINLDITENLKARGSVGANGDSGLGVFYEKDY